jgi:hypothetical protein
MIRPLKVIGHWVTVASPVTSLICSVDILSSVNHTLNNLNVPYDWSNYIMPAFSYFAGRSWTTGTSVNLVKALFPGLKVVAKQRLSTSRTRGQPSVTPRFIGSIPSSIVSDWQFLCIF